MVWVPLVWPFFAFELVWVLVLVRVVVVPAVVVCLLVGLLVPVARVLQGGVQGVDEAVVVLHRLESPRRTASAGGLLAVEPLVSDEQLEKVAELEVVVQVEHAV